jgi:hypothetical protein
MSSEIATTLTGIGGPIILAAGSYLFTKKRERDAELRKEKLEHYKTFVLCLSGIIKGEDTPEGQRAFSRACNGLNLIAPQQVLHCLHALQDEITVANPHRNYAREDQLRSALFLAIRRDLGIKPRDKGQLDVRLWSSGIRPNP